MAHAFNYHRAAIPLEQCEAIAQESYDLLERNAAIKHHLVALAKKWSIDRLRRVGILETRLSRAVPEVLFVDTGDSGAPAAAAVLLARYASGRVHASSAGEKPRAELYFALVHAHATDQQQVLHLGPARPRRPPRRHHPGTCWANSTDAR